VGCGTPGPSIGSPIGFIKELLLKTVLLVVGNEINAGVVRAIAVAVMVEAKTSNSKRATFRRIDHHLLHCVFSDKSK